MATYYRTFRDISKQHQSFDLSGKKKLRLVPTYITAFGDEILFSGYDSGYNANAESPNDSPNLWISNGTGTGTNEIGGVSPGSLSGSASAIADGSPTCLNPIAPSGNSAANDFVVFGDEAFFFRTNATGDDDLWVTNGTLSGTEESAE
jgi:hypothetical protein